MELNQEKIERLQGALKTLPRIKLAALPTPLEEAQNLSRELGGPRILFKRDDLTGLAFGGNKTRMFEFVLGRIKEEGYDAIVAGAAVQSNYCRQLAAACAKLNLDLHLLLRPIRGEKDLEIQGNLLLDLLTKARVTILEDPSREYQWEVAQELMSTLTAEGRKPYLGRTISQEGLWLDSCAYIVCMLEILEELERREDEITHLYVSALDTTHAGLLFATSYLEVGIRVVAIHPADTFFLEGDSQEEVAKIFADISTYLSLPQEFDPHQFISLSQYVGEGYGVMTDEGRDAIKLVAETEGIFLDPVYTGKAMAALIDGVKKGDLTRDDTVVFIHTGGNPALFAYEDQLQLSLDK